MREEGGQARGVGKEGQEPPNTSKMYRATGKAGGELGRGPCSSGWQAALPGRKGIRVKRRGWSAAGSANDLQH